MIEEMGEGKTHKALSCFLCGINRDVESFLHDKAIDFARQNISQTHLIMTPHKGSMVIAGRIIYLESEDKYILREFYESNGFCLFGERSLELSEDREHNGKLLLQYLKYT